MCIDTLDLRDQLDSGHGAWEQSAQERAWLARAGSLYCFCGHSALMHDSGGGCSLCACRGFRG